MDLDKIPISVKSPVCSGNLYKKTTFKDNLYTIDLDSEEQGEGEGGEHHQQGHEGQQAGAHARALLARRS